MIKFEPLQVIFYLLLIALNTLNFITYISVSLQVTLHTIILVYLGSLHSIRLYAKEVKNEDEGVEKMTQKDAWLFPVFGSATLFGIFLLFKYFDKANINVFFHVYFSFIGTYVIASFLYNRLSYSLASLRSNVVFTVPQIKFLSDKPSQVDALFLLCFTISIVPGITYYFTKYYQLNNLMGIAFCLFGIENIMLGSFKVGFILLSLLFFYDIYWVFFTPVMVTVAKNLEGPIKLMFPKMFDWSEPKDFNMIGLGDIVIPGIFVALMLRYDYLRTLARCRKEMRTVEEDVNKNAVVLFNCRNFRTFIWTFVGYTLGILTTLAIMNFFMKAQPALLYLVPGCLVGSMLTALFSRGFNDLWNFDEENVLVELGIQEKKEEKQDKQS